VSPRRDRRVRRYPAARRPRFHCCAGATAATVVFRWLVHRVRAYYGAVLAAESLKTAEQAVRSAEADLKRAESVHAGGTSTDVDVVSISGVSRYRAAQLLGGAVVLIACPARHTSVAYS
jgi:hypothetical protein